MRILFVSLLILSTSSIAFTYTKPQGSARVSAPVYEYEIAPMHNLEVFYEFKNNVHQLVCVDKNNVQQGVFVNWLYTKDNTHTSTNHLPLTIKNDASVSGEWADDVGLLSISNFNRKLSIVITCEYKSTKTIH